MRMSEHKKTFEVGNVISRIGGDVTTYTVTYAANDMGRLDCRALCGDRMGLLKTFRYEDVYRVKKSSGIPTPGTVESVEKENKMNQRETMAAKSIEYAKRNAPAPELRVWKIHTTHVCQVDLDMVSDCLTPKDPIAIIRMPNQVPEVMVRRSFHDKMDLCERAEEFHQRMKGIIPINQRRWYEAYVVYEIDDESMLQSFLSIWKDVRKDSIQSAYASKGVTTISLARV